MAIAKHPKRNQTAIEDVVAERFISGAAKQLPAADEEPAGRRVPGYEGMWVTADQAASLASTVLTSMPSLNLTPSMTFGN